MRMDIVEIRVDIIKMSIDIVDMRIDIVDIRMDIIDIRVDIVDMSIDIADMCRYCRYVRTWLRPRCTLAVSLMYMILPSLESTKMKPSRVCSRCEPSSFIT